MANLMWYVPAGIVETIGFVIFLWVSWRLAKSLEIYDKDLIQERLSQVIKSIKVNENLENKIKNALTKEINYIWGKKPFVEVIIHYN